MGKLFLKILVVIGGIALIGLLLTNYDYYYGESTSLKLCMDQAYESNENYDFIILGSSTAYSSYETKIIDQELGVHSLNLGSEFQLVCDSYALLHEVVKNNQVKYVLMDMNPYYFYGNVVYEDSMSNSTVNTLPALRPSLFKMAYTIQMITARPAIAGELLEYDIEPKSFFQPYEKKYCWSSFEGDNSVEVSHQGDKLYLTCADGSSLGNVQTGLFTDHSIGWNYLNKIYELCKDNNIELLWTTSGPTDAYVLQIEHWELMHNEFAEQAEEWQLPYYDFTYAKPELFLRSYENWTDSLHLSKIGAEKVTEALCQFIKGRSSSGLFYSNYDDYLACMDIASLWVEADESGNLLANCSYGMDSEPEYAFYGSDDGANWVLIQDYSRMNKIPLERYKAYNSIKVTGRLIDGDLERWCIYETGER